MSGLFGLGHSAKGKASVNNRFFNAMRYAPYTMLFMVEGLGGGDLEQARERLHKMGASEPHDLSQFGDVDVLRELFARLLP